MSGFGGISRALSHRDFRIYVAGASVSLIGTWLQKAAIGWLAWDLTHDPFWVGIVASADLLPIMAMSPFAGLLADRTSRKSILLWTQSLAGVQAAILTVAAWAGFLSVELLVALTVTLGIVMGFNQPARQSIINGLVTREDLSAAVALHSVIFNTARVIGPALAGFLIHFTSAGFAFALNSLSFVAMIVALSLIRAPDSARAKRGQSGALGDILAGYRYAFGHRGIAPMLAFSMSAALLVRPVLEMLPAYVGQVFAGGADKLGIMMSINGVGAVAVGAWIAWRGSNRGLVSLTLASMIVSAAALAGFASTGNFWVATLFIVFLGASRTLRGTTTQALIQNAVDPEMRGRVLSLNTMIFNAGPGIGAFALGSVAAWYGLQSPLYVAVVLTLIVWAWGYARRGELVSLLEGGRTSEAPRRQASATAPP